jgi:serine/threonine-protein kinase
MSLEQEQRRGPMRFGKYTLIDRLAVGGMAEIFLARQAGLAGFEKTVVIKRIRPHLSKEANFVRMFLNEAKLAAQLNHPNVVQIYDLGKINESYFIAMEYLFGRDMRKIIPKAETLGIPFPMVYALKIASSVCEGLYYAHQRSDRYGNPLNIVHRDVTPENIFVSFDGTVKILDFGIAKAANRTDQTRAGEIKGKLSYMSPEQCMGRPLDRRSDLFSLGVVLYEWLTGFKLFTGDSEVAILRSITEGKIYAPSYFKSDIPDAVERILMRALEKDRDQRYQTAWEMQYDLDQFLGQYEFTPSNIHLSNFLKQLFSDELDAERHRLNHAVLGRGDISAVNAVPPPLPADALAENVAEEMLEDLEESLSKDPDDESTVAAPPPSHMGPMVPVVPPLAAVSTLEGNGDPSRVTVQLELRESELLTLEQLALKHGLTPQALAREVLSTWLKYR